MLSAMSACIISLRLIDIAPRSIHDWIDKSSRGQSIRLDTANKNLARQEMPQNSHSRFETVMWEGNRKGSIWGA